MKKRTKVIMGIVVVAVAAGGFFVWRNSTAEPVNPNLNAPTMELAKSDMVKTVSASGAVKSATTVNIYSTQSAYPVMEILAETGDTVKKGDVLARLDMSKLENEIHQAELNLENARVSAGEEIRTNENNVSNLESSLAGSQISLERQAAATATAEQDLKDAQLDAAEPFDSYTYDKNIEDARVTVERAEETLQTAQEDLDEALNDFDDYDYQTKITEASVQVERAEKELADELAKDKNTEAYTYQYQLDEAQRAYTTAQEDKIDKQEALDAAKDAYNNIFVVGSALTQTTIDAAQAKIDAAELALKTAKTTEEKAQRTAAKAKEDLKNYEDNYEETKAATVEKLQNALADVQRTLDTANENSERAKENAVKSTQDAYDDAQEKLFDARRQHEKLLSDKERAIEVYIEDNTEKLDAAEQALADSQKLLQTQQNSLASAQNSLQQASEKPLTGATSVELQQLSLDKLYETLKEGEIIATEDGVITELNAKVGAAPSGILFVIEDARDLYVAANIKEYSLSDIAIGQKALVTTDATGDEVYDAEVNYISPKAVSEAGSTSVEFEIRAAFDSGDAVKIGMNAFLNVVTETRESVYSVPLSAIVTDPRGSFVYSPNGAERIEIPVTVGIKTTTQGEISGAELKDGLVILTQPAELSRSNMPNMMMF